MSRNKHGFTVGLNRIEEQYILTIKVVGTLKDEDYKVMVPILDNIIRSIKNPKVKVFVDGLDLDGWEIKAAWDDLKFGLKHGNDFSKIAFLGNKKWERLSAKIGSWFYPGEMKYFENEAEAIYWLIAD